MYRQISKCTDKSRKRHYWGGGQLPPPPPPPLATLMNSGTYCALGYSLVFRHDQFKKKGSYIFCDPPVEGPQGTTAHLNNSKTSVQNNIIPYKLLRSESSDENIIELICHHYLHVVFFIVSSIRKLPPRK